MDEFTIKRTGDIQEVERWIKDDLQLNIAEVKQWCNSIRHFDPEELKKAHVVLQKVSGILKASSTGQYVSSDSDEYDAFRLVHQLVYGGCESIDRLQNVIDVFLDILSEVDTKLFLAFWVLIDLIVGFLGLIIKAFDNQTEIWA